MRNRRARLKRDLQVANARIADLEATRTQTDASHEEAVKELERNLLTAKDELAAERRKNAGLKDLVVRVTGQRDDALAKLAGIRRMSTVNPSHAVSWLSLRSVICLVTQHRFRTWKSTLPRSPKPSL